MRYFFISQNISLPAAITLRDFDIKGASHLFTRADKDRLNSTTALFLAGTGREARPDFIQRPVIMFSARLKQLVDAYESDLIYKDVTLIHKENSIQYGYVQVLMDELEAVSEKTEYYPNQTPKHLVLDRKAIAHHHMFLLAGKFRKDPVVSLALAESLLRRNVTGIRFEEVEVN